jgi:hypothetical protein
VFREPRSIFAGADCVVWVADRLEGVYRLSCKGGQQTLVAAVGHESTGYQVPWAVGPASGASAATFDRGRQRVRSYSNDGGARELRDLRFPEAATGEVAAIALTRSGVTVWLHQFPNATDPGSLNSLVIAFNSADGRRDTLFVSDGIPSIYWGSAFAGSHLGLPHHRRPLLAFGPDGEFVSGMSDGSSVALHDASGRMLREIQLEFAAARAIGNSDRDTYADSVRKSTDREMTELHYNAPERKKFQAQITTYLREDVVFPPQRQLYERFIVDSRGQHLWVGLTGAAKNYTRSWEIYSLETGAFERRVTVSHKGAVVSGAVHEGALYVIEQPLGGKPRIVRYDGK